MRTNRRQRLFRIIFFCIITIPYYRIPFDREGTKIHRQPPHIEVLPTLAILWAKYTGLVGTYSISSSFFFFFSRINRITKRFVKNTFKNVANENEN